MGEHLAAKRIRVYVGEADQSNGHPLSQVLVRRAKEAGLAGATVLRGILGYGCHSALHALHPFGLQQDLPLVLELVDTPEKVDAFLPVLDRLVEEGLITVDDVEVVFYRHPARVARPTRPPRPPPGRPRRGRLSAATAVRRARPERSASTSARRRWPRSGGRRRRSSHSSPR